MKRFIHMVAVLFLLLAAILGACNDQDNFGGIGDETTWLLVTVRKPDARAATRQQTDENNISNLRFFVFEQNGSEYNFWYQVQAFETSPAGNTQRFRAQLAVTDTPLKIIAVANIDNLIGTYEPAAGTPEAEVRAGLEFSFPSGGLTGNLPMYGEYVLDNGLRVGENNISISVLRAVARVDVVDDLEESDEFILEEVHAFRVYDRARIIPDPVADITSPVVTAPSIPEDAVFMDNPISLIAAGGAQAITNLYIPESYAAATDIEKLTGTTVVIIGGRYNGGSEITYYRADFDPDQDGNNFGQVLRNNRYIFYIKNVGAPGWSTIRDAAENFSSPIQIDVQAWNDFGADIIFGESRFSISSRSMSLRYVANRTKRIDVESTLSYAIQWLDDNGNPEGTPISSENTVISNANFDVSIVRDGGDPATVSHLQFRTRNNNYTGTSVITGILRIYVGDSTIDIAVNQDNVARYSGRSFNVLSGYDSEYSVGHLGTTGNTNPTISTWGREPGLAMRNILDVQFAPAGIIQIGGFAFDVISDATDFFSSTTNTNVEKMRRICRMQDVIFLTYHTSVSTQVANVLLDEWLPGDPRRVLIIGVDDNETNISVINQLSVDATWSYSLSTGGYTRANASDRTTDFFSGPFGTVNAGEFANARVDNALGYSTNYSADRITPLILSTSNNAMILGVNQDSRIIYIGDVNLFQYNANNAPLSNNIGNVNTNLDRLMANMWAWIVEQAIYGDD